MSRIALIERLRLSINCLAMTSSVLGEIEPDTDPEILRFRAAVTDLLHESVRLTDRAKQSPGLHLVTGEG